MYTCRIKQLEKCDPTMFGDLIVTCQTPTEKSEIPAILPISYSVAMRRYSATDALRDYKFSIFNSEKRRATALVDELLMDIYYTIHTGTTDYNSTSGKSLKSSFAELPNLDEKDVEELLSIISCFRNYIERIGRVLVRQLKRRDSLRRQQEALCDVITRELILRAPQTSSTNMRFAIQPFPGDTGFSQWVSAMKMVAQLPGGIPPEFRKRLWLTMADKHLAARGVDWSKVERNCFNEWSHPADAELGVQIVKDLHRTGCSLFCGEDGQENQALLKRVLLAYARWNKAVGYCQGFNMLAALILQVTDKCESDALKLMIYLIEGVLPDSYFADSLRGLSVDMAVFRELLRSRLPKLSKHLDVLQNAAKDGTRSYEPPLTNVFTMQWFLTLFCNCLPQPTVLRVWDLIFLEGNEVLLRTALAIWQVLAVRILTVRTADEFYCLMGVLTREILEFDLVDANSLIKAVVAIGPLTELPTLREHYLYNINPWGSAITQAVDKQVKLYTRQSIALDIGALKKQYTKLKQRQRQAHIIFSAAITRQPPPSPPVTMNHLLLGKSALVPAKRLGPPPGSIPPPPKPPSTLHWRDAPKQQSSSSSSSDTELCDEESDHNSDVEDKGDTQFIDDNPQQVSDIIVTNDNTTTSADISGTVEVDNHSLMTDSLTNIKSESDDESVDFEQFLIDRVKCMRDFDEESAAEEKINFARRNSQKALQIIQENSLILQRIMQCQSRLSPPFNIQDQERETVDLDESMHSPLTLLSPNIIPVRPQLTPLHIPVLDSGEAIHSWDTNFFSNTDEASSKDDFQTECPISPTPLKVGTMYPKTLLTDEIDNKILEKGEKSSSNSLNQSEITRSTQLKIAISPAIEQDVISPAYGSRYTNILEKSKSLDERYNALILGKQPYDLPRTDEVDGLQTSYSWSISSPSEPRFTDQQDISPTNNTSTVTHNDILNEESVKLNVERGFIGDDTDVVGKIEPLNTDPLSSIKNIEDQKLSAQVAEISPTENDIRYLDNRSVTVNRFDSKFEDFFNQIAVTKGNSNSSQTLHDKYDTLDSFDFTYSRYTQKDAPEFTELDQFSPLDSKEYKLATPEFERFYTITRDNATKDMSPLECGNNINIEGSILHPGLSGEKNIPYSNCSPKHSPAPSTSSFKSHSKENEDTKSSYEDINNLEITISGDFSSNSFSSSSKTCYSYISSKSDSAYSTADSTRTESIISGNVDQIASKRTTLKLDLSSPGTLVSPLISPLKPLKSPSRSPLKSPSRGFNPFPVQNNSRQNKEVLLKLGLYKK